MASSIGLLLTSCQGLPWDDLIGGGEPEPPVTTTSPEPEPPVTTTSPEPEPPVTTTSPEPEPGATSTSTTPAPTGDHLSGLPWSSGVWGANRGSGVTAFEAGPRAGARADNILVYTSRQTQAAQHNPGAWRSGLPADFDPQRQDLVLAVTSQTEDNAGMTAAQASDMGSAVCSIDSNAVVRLDWEMNLPDGTANGAELNAGNFDTWVARFETVAVGMKATCPGVRIDFNPNHGADQTSGCGGDDPANWCTRRAFQLVKEHVAFFGIDTYDSYPPVTSASGWDYRLTTAGELDESRRYAVANGKLFTVPEWGVACNGGGCQWAGNAGGDNPTYVERHLDYFSQHAADMGYETYFNEPASYIVSDLVTSNPAARAAMQAGIREHSSAV